MLTALLLVLAQLPPPLVEDEPALSVPPVQTNGRPPVAAGECATVPLAGSRGETITFTRATASTCTRTDGGMVWLDGGMPATSGGALLVRGAVVNNMAQTEGLNSYSAYAFHNGTNPTVSTNAAASPNGTVNAERFQIAAAASNASSGMNSSGSHSVTSGSTYTHSLYVAGNGDAGTIYLGDWNSGGDKCTRTACNYPAAGYARCTHTFTADETASHRQWFGFMGLFGCGAHAVTANDFFAWGSQVVAGSVAKDYCPNHSSGSSTCNAETATTTAPALGSTPSLAATVKLPALVSGCALSVGDEARLCLDAGYPSCSLYLTDGGWQTLYAASAVTANVSSRLSCQADGTNLFACRDGACASAALAGTPNGAAATVWLGGSADAGGQTGGSVGDLCTDTRPWVCR